MRLDVELLQFADRQVDASPARIVADVANDVGELQRKAETMRVVARCDAIGAAEDAGRYLADDAGHQVAVVREAGVVEVARLVQVHLAAFDHGVEVLAARCRSRPACGISAFITG